MKSPPHALPPPPPPHRHNIDRCIKRTIGNTGVTDRVMLFLTTGMSRFFAKFPFLPPPPPPLFAPATQASKIRVEFEALRAT